MTNRLLSRLGGALLLLGAAGYPAWCETVAEPAQYRDENYRAPVPATLDGVTVVDDDAAYALWQTGRVAFIDVLPHTPKPGNLPEGTIWREKPHFSIPGSTWLINVGYGRIHPKVDQYFRDHLARITGDDPSYPVLFFCLPDCWMSWNAAKRAHEEYGYARVFWYPGGSDAWQAAGHDLEATEPAQ